MKDEESSSNEKSSQTHLKENDRKNKEQKREIKSEDEATDSDELNRLTKEALGRERVTSQDFAEASFFSTTLLDGNLDL